ncbi:hypothetical protein POM88_025057 [Heracleum sosnowskyi]|uniref:Uncharacterized protein n=1 Tax=Heracleum sosnowskyi TaxID=360622 RepID=A0AAD8I5P7_9APIA|nr:hypothetical protein POM88_025057 [Heracleum sosnowskyi]
MRSKYFYLSKKVVPPCCLRTHQDEIPERLIFQLPNGQRTRIRFEKDDGYFTYNINGLGWKFVSIYVTIEQSIKGVVCIFDACFGQFGHIIPPQDIYREFSIVTNKWNHGDELRIIPNDDKDRAWYLQIRRTTKNRVRIHDQWWIGFVQDLHFLVRDVLIFDKYK